MEILNAVVTGGASGLGRGFCTELARPSARILVCDIDEEGGEHTVELAKENGADARFLKCDVRSLENVEEVERTAQQWFGDSDLLVNNAGVAVGGRFEEVSTEDWQWIMDINLWGVIHGCRTFLPPMQSRGAGHIINVASAAGLLSPPMMAPYNVTKAAVVALTESMHAENQESGVHTTVLCPTFFPTNIGKNARAPESAKTKLVEKLMEKSKLKANDVARVAIASVKHNDLYAVPMADGRNLWRAKRANPRRFAELLGSSRIKKLLDL